MTKLSDGELVELFLSSLRDQEVVGWKRIEEVTGIPRNTYYRLEKRETVRLNHATRARLESWLESIGVLRSGVVVPTGDPVDELIRALSHPAVRGFLGSLSASDRVAAAMAYADARKFTPEQKARIHRWAADELAHVDYPEPETATTHHSR
jgi:hypothetical protein